MHHTICIMYIQFLYIIPQWIPYQRFTFCPPYSIISNILHALVSITILRGVTRFSRITKIVLWKWGTMDSCHLNCAHLLLHLTCSWNRSANKKAEVTHEYSRNFPTEDMRVEEVGGELVNQSVR
jgi:hypothetical protein